MFKYDRTSVESFDDYQATQLNLYRSNELNFEENIKSSSEKEYHEKKVKGYERSFYWFSTVASLNHALNYVVNAYSTTLLSPRLAGVCLGLNWSLNSVSGLTIATPAVRFLGFKYAMIISFWGYAFQIATLYWAVVQPSMAWPVGIVGAVVAGFTSAIWWSAQGVCFELTCSKINEHSVYGESVNGIINEIRSNLSAVWTVIYQLSDIVVFLALSLFPIFVKVSIHVVILALTGLGIMTAVLGFTFNSLGDHGDVFQWGALFDAVVAVPIQFSTDCRATLLAPFVFGFGITTAMFAYYLNEEAISDSASLGPLSLGLLEAFSYFIATLAAYPYAYVANRFVGGQHLVIQFGSLSFLLTGVLVFFLTKEQLGTWQNILIIKGLYGLGRGVFEGSCRAVYAEIFMGPDLSTAFSAQTLLAGFSGGICYFIFGFLSKGAIASITVVNGIFAILFYSLLLNLDYRNKQSWGDFYASFQKLGSWKSSRSSMDPQAINVSLLTSSTSTRQ